MKNLKLYLAILSACMLCTVQVHAVTLYIGDKDGFGYGDAHGFVGADGKPAERVGNRTILDMGDGLPDRNKDGQVHFRSDDNFDYRSVAEKNDVGNSGVKWTDVSLSKSYDNRPGIAGEAVFVFRFNPPKASDADYGRDHFINLVYGDYDHNPMVIEVDGKAVYMVDNPKGSVDGYIWRAYSTVSWNNMKDGRVVIKVMTDDPYVAFDYALLDVKKLVIHKPNPVGMLFLLLDD